MGIIEVISNEWFIKSLLVLGLIIAGIIVGNLVNFLIKKASEHLDFKRKVNEGSIKIFSLVITWAIYLTFIIWAISELGIPSVTDIMTRFLIVIPAFVG
ncbi:MAG: hypothetical protein Q8L27_00940, partial [archaeon]|nr:hypothetical protein [archaeon]